MHGRLWILLLCCTVLVLACGVPAWAGDTEYADGEVLFASRYGEYTSLRDTGLRFGTASWDGASLSLGESGLSVGSASDYKTWLLLPPDLPFPATYTVVYTFRFTELLAANGACGFLLTSSGDAPSNRTEAVVRASGDCGDFGVLGRSLAAAMQDGEWVTVRIPIRHGMLSELEVSAAGESETMQLKNVRSVARGGRGFVFRNASVEIGSVLLVSGADFGAKPLGGWYAAHNYIAPDDFAWEERTTQEDPVPIENPGTADAAVWIALSGGIAAAAAAGMRRRRKR